MTITESRPATRRLLLGTASGSGSNLAAHLGIYGPSGIANDWDAATRTRLLDEIGQSGLTGRGGAGFPAARKHGTIDQHGGRPILVVNALEGEPASAKDQVLLQLAPHLVLDGAESLALAMQAARVVIALPSLRSVLAAELGQAIGERHDPVGVEIELIAERYVAGEESAVVAALAGGSGIPAFRPDKSVPLLLRRRPVLVHNVETLAHIALIARHGASWFRSVGVSEAPGTCLVTLSGAVGRPGVVEVETGTSVSEIVGYGAPITAIEAVLVGGYGGAWIGSGRLDVPFAPRALRALGTSMGAGILAVLPEGSCGLRETARIARYMAGESAAQCGPCLFGLPSIARDLEEIAAGDADGPTLARVQSRCRAVVGRGACRHPDGVARLVASALDVFAADLAAHIAGRPCPGGSRRTVLPFPSATRVERGS